MQLALDDFRYAHLPPHLQKVSCEFYYVADRMIKALPPGDGLKSVLLRLWEAKNLAVLLLVNAEGGAAPWPSREVTTPGTSV